ncbi:MAG: D-alanyl-D-alanine carboxypeptidase/D-alanyl-D-alanine-endopeptidase [Gammaproteobacteria bacterium SHHR-1]
MPLFRTPLTLFLCLMLGSLAAEPLRLQETLPEGSQFGLYVQYLKPVPGSDRVALEHNADLLLPPASTLKLLTALAARLVLPNDFRFVTEVLTNPNGQNSQDWVIRFGGDTSLSREQLKQLLSKAKTALGASQVRDIWIDDSAFVGHERGLGWPWENLGACYSSPVTAVSIDDNCVPAAVYSNLQPGQRVRVNVPKHQPIEVLAEADVVSASQQRERLCNLDLSGGDDNRYRLSGCWPQSKNPLPLKLAVQNPARFAQDIVRAQAKALDLNLKGQVRIGRPSGPAGKTMGKTLALHRSAPLPDLLRQMLHRSDNQMADALLKTLGGRFHQLPGSYRAGLSALRRVLRDQAGIDLSRAIIEDGSGLSRSNRLSPRQLGQVLDYLYRNDAQLGLLDLLPVSGESGTLQYRRSLSRPPLKGRYRAKTGTLFGTRNLAGIFTTAKGSELLVVQFISNYFPIKDTAGPKPYIRFEQRLYNGLYSDF